MCIRKVYVSSIHYNYVYVSQDKYRSENVMVAMRFIHFVLQIRALFCHALFKNN